MLKAGRWTITALRIVISLTEEALRAARRGPVGSLDSRTSRSVVGILGRVVEPDVADQLGPAALARLREGIGLVVGMALGVSGVGSALECPTINGDALQ